MKKVKIIASRTQMTHHAESTGETLRASFRYKFSVSTIRDLVERRFNQVLKAVTQEDDEGCGVKS